MTDTTADLPLGVELPLTGLRVLDCVDGPLQSVGRIYADLGAEVIRVEPTAGSPARSQGLMVAGVSLTFAVRNANKLSVVADLGTEAGRERLRALISSADILVTDWTPSQQADLGLSSEALAELNPRLVAAVLSDFGRTGPRRDWQGGPDVLFALSSVLSRSGLPEVTEPLLPPAFLAYESAAVQAAWAVMVSYVHATRTGRGDYVDYSCLQGLIQILDPPMGVAGSARAGAPMRNLPRGRPDSRHLYPIFPAADGWVRICVLSARQWRGMFAWLGEPAEFADPKYDNIGTRFAAIATLYPMIGAKFATLTRAEITDQGQAHGVPTAGLASTSEVLASDAFWAAGAFDTAEVGPDVRATLPTGVFELDGRRAGRRTPAPALGADQVDLDRRPVATSTAASAAQPYPFAGLRVLDLGVIVVGAELGRLLADYGADVIKVESREFPDGSRQSYDGSEMTEGFAWGHRNKRSLGLNLKSDAGKSIFKDLVAQSDVVLTNFKPGTLESLGFGYETLRSINPRIVLSESSAFGNSGPWSRRMGYGPLVRASAGLSKLWAYPEIEGSFSDAITIFPDHVVGRLNAIAVAALLLRRGRTGRGGRVSTAQVDAIFAGMADELALESLVPGSLQMQGNHRGGDAPRGVFPAAGDDDWLVVDCTSQAHFQALAGVIGRPQWQHDPGLATADGRLDRSDEIEGALVGWAASHPAVTAAELLQQAGVPAAEMVRMTEFESDPHLRARGGFGWMSQPQLADELMSNLGEAVTTSLPDPLLGPAPLQAEHTRTLVTEILGLGDAEVDDLIAAGVLQVHPSAARPAVTSPEGVAP